MIEDKLQINLITYNRAEPLDRTLTQLRQGPFAKCKITVIDNCSTDGTPEVCARHQALFDDLHIVRHPKNIGVGGNYLRAVELSSALYTWILCDDDRYDWSAADDVIEAIEEARFDLICVGAPGQFEWERGLKTTTKGLWKRGARFFFVHTFFPSIIFKTEKFDSECLTLGYYNAANGFSNHRFISKALEQNLSEYVSRRPMVTRDAEQTVYHGLHMMVLGFNSSATIPDPRVRRGALYEGAESRRQWLRMIAEQVVLAKLDKPEKALKVPHQFAQMAQACVGEQRMRILLLTPLVLIPPWAYRLARRTYRSLRGRSNGWTDFSIEASKAPAGDAATDPFR